MPRVAVIAASLDQQPLLANLLELYIHDFSEFVPVELGEEGRFGYPSLPRYWSEPGRKAFLIRYEGKLAGFALVKKGSELTGNHAAWDMAEFFILRGYRRRGIGATAAQQLWKVLPGLWEVRVMQENGQARGFWGRAIEELLRRPVASTRIETKGRTWDLFSFESKEQH